MEEIFSIEELAAMVKGFAKYIDNQQLNKSRFLCHPIYENKVFALQLPGLDWAQACTRLPVSFSFLGSTDGESWGECDLEKMIECVENGDDYFISDLGCRTYLSVDYTIIEDVLDLLNREMPLIFIDTDAWIEGELGELTTISQKDAFELMNPDKMF